MQAVVSTRPGAWAATIYGGYAKYLSRISGREVRVFVLAKAD